MSLVDMSPVNREEKVDDLADAITEVFRVSGPLDGDGLFTILAERTGAPVPDVRLAFGRVAIRVTADGKIILR